MRRYAVALPVYCGPVVQRVIVRYLALGCNFSLELSGISSHLCCIICVMYMGLLVLGVLCRQILPLGSALKAKEGIKDIHRRFAIARADP